MNMIKPRRLCPPAAKAPAHPVAQKVDSTTPHHKKSRKKNPEKPLSDEEFEDAIKSVGSLEDNENWDDSSQASSKAIKMRSTTMAQ
jgi:hypothetical protein